MEPPSEDTHLSREPLDDYTTGYLYQNMRLSSNYLSPERKESDAVRQTLRFGKYPRPDTGFGKKECLEIDIYYSNCY